MKNRDLPKRLANLSEVDLGVVAADLGLVLKEFKPEYRVDVVADRLREQGVNWAVLVKRYGINENNSITILPL